MPPLSPKRTTTASDCPRPGASANPHLDRHSTGIRRAICSHGYGSGSNYSCMARVAQPARQPALLLHRFRLPLRTTDQRTLRRNLLRRSLL